jgi:hypothetical protein
MKFFILKKGLLLTIILVKSLCIKLPNSMSTPRYDTKVVASNVSVGVSAPSSVTYNWKPHDPRDANLWQNVEYNRYGNRLLDTSKYQAPAFFTQNNYGNTVVHGPANHGIQIISPTTTTLTSGVSFLELQGLLNPYY